MTGPAEQNPPAGEPLEPRRRAWWAAFGVSTLVFVLGAVAGSVVTMALLRNSDPWRFDAPPFRPERIAERLSKDLELSDAQSARVSEIFRSQHDQLKAIREDTVPRVRAVLDETHALVLEELSEEQRVKWETQFDRMRRRMKAPGWDRSRRGDGGDSRWGRWAPDPVRLLEKHDVDGDGQLSYDEWSAVYEARTRSRFQRLDRDGNGSIDRSELAGSLPAEDLRGMTESPRNAVDE